MFEESNLNRCFLEATMGMAVNGSQKFIRRHSKYGRIKLKTKKNITIGGLRSNNEMMVFKKSILNRSKFSRKKLHRCHFFVQSLLIRGSYLHANCKEPTRVFRMASRNAYEIKITNC